MDYVLSKMDAAVDQLDWAIRLFLDRQAYVPAITLAGAAEEIIGEALQEKAVFSRMKKKFAVEFGVSEKLISQAYLNKTKNWLKHWQHLHEQETINVDLEAETVQYVVRALTNLVLYDRSLSSEGPRFFEWLSKNQQRLNIKCSMFHTVSLGTGDG